MQANKKERAEAIQGLRPTYGLDALLKLEGLGMARSTFYYNLAAIRRGDPDAVLKKRVYEIYHKHKGRYGYRRITLALQAEGMVVNHKKVERIMKEMGLKAVIRVVKYHSYKGTVGKIASNLVDRDFKTDRPLKKLATDVSQVKIGGERIEGAILHSDQGWQYQNSVFVQALEKHGIKQSMSRKGNCLDNAMMESFFGSMKSELLYLENFESIDQFERALKEYIRYYNHDRIKTRLKMSPVAYRINYENQVNNLSNF